MILFPAAGAIIWSDRNLHKKNKYHWSRSICNYYIAKGFFTTRRSEEDRRLRKIADLFFSEPIKYPLY